MGAVCDRALFLECSGCDVNLVWLTLVDQSPPNLGGDCETLAPLIRVYLGQLCQIPRLQVLRAPRRARRP